MINSSLVVFDANNKIQDTLTANANTEITYTATQNYAINYCYYFKLSDGGTGACSVDRIVIAPIYCASVNKGDTLYTLEVYFISYVY